MAARVTVARGKTYLIREILKLHGFTFHGPSKTWRADPVLTDEQIEDLRRVLRRTSLPDFDASQVEVRNIRLDFLVVVHFEIPAPVPPSPPSAKMIS